MTLAPWFRAGRSRNPLLSSGEDFLKAPGRSSDKLQPEVMEGSWPARMSCQWPSLRGSAPRSGHVPEGVSKANVLRVSLLYANPVLKGL